MLMAVCGDIHGNLPAFEAVLNAVDEAGIRTIVCTGDCVVGHPWPNEVIGLLRERRIPCVQGAWDRRAVSFHRKQEQLRGQYSADELDALRWTYENTGSRNLEYLRELPRQRVLTIDGIGVFLCHGTPHGQNDGLREDDDIVKFRRLRETANTEIILCGRTHEPFSRIVEGALFANPGTTGIASEDPPQASYAVIDTEADPWQVHFHKIGYPGNAKCG